MIMEIRIFLDQVPVGLEVDLCDDYVQPILDFCCKNNISSGISLSDDDDFFKEVKE